MLKRLYQSTILRSAGKLMSGRIGSMAIGVAGTPIIARLFSPDDYGVAAVFLAAATVTAGVTPAGYQRAVLFPREEKVAARLLALALLVSLALTALSLLVYGAATVMSPDFGRALRIGNVLWLLPLAALALAARDAVTVALLRASKFSTIAAVDITQSAVIAASRIAWGLVAGSAALGLITGHIVGLIVAFAIALRSSWPWLTAGARGLSLKRLASLAAEYRDYPLFRVPARLAFITADQLPTIALGLLFPPATVGFFAMANRVAALPLQAASRSLSDAVLRKAIGERHGERAVSPGISKAAGLLVVVGIPIFTLMHFQGSEVLTWFLGARWFDAGQMLEIMAVYLFFAWIGSAFTPVFETLRKNKLQLVLHWLNLSVRIAVFGISFSWKLDVYQTLWAFVAVACVHQVLVIGVAWRTVTVYDKTRFG